MKCFKNFLLLLCCVVAFWNVAQHINAAEPAKNNQPTKVAFLVGVSEYEKAGLRNLKYAEVDATDLAKELKSAGFTVHVLTGSASGADRATRENIRTSLEQSYVNELKKLKKSDISLVCLSGHGMQFNVTKNGVVVEDAFYCPVDALRTDPATMLSVSDLMENIAANSGAENNLFVIDACRDNPAKGGKGIDGSRISLPGNVAVLFGASSGTQSYESEQLKHGLLTYYLLEGIRGKVKDDEGDVTWDALAGYAKKQVAINARKLIGEEQTPISPSGIKGAPPVLARISISAAIASKTLPASPSTARPAMLVTPTYEAMVKLRQIEWAKHLGQESPQSKNSIGMHLTLIPPGEFMMGNKETPEELMKVYPGVPRTSFEGQTSHKVRITKPFQMGTFEVTKGQYAKFVAATGYKTDSEKDGKGGWGYNWNKKEISQDPKYSWRDTGFVQNDELPVVNVNREDAIAFCEWLSNVEGRKYRLPTEAEWEYACRAGTDGLYYNGNDPQKVVEIANVWDVSVKKEYFPRAISYHTRSDGFIFGQSGGKYSANRFGLYDMLGNVQELCNDWYDPDYYLNGPTDDPRGGMSKEYRVTRGGGWYTELNACRAAHRMGIFPNNRYIDIGFRVCLTKE